MSSTNINKLKDELVKQLDARGGVQAKWLSPFSDNINTAKAVFQSDGFPHIRNEEWKYTPLSSILSEALVLPDAVAESKGYALIQPYIARFI